LIVKGTVLGVCIVNDLDVKIGTGQFIDVSAMFTDAEISRSMTPPKGGLYTAIKAGLVEEVDANDPGFLRYREKETDAQREQERASRRREPSAETRDYFKMSDQDKIAYLDTLTPRDVKLLLRFRQDEEGREMLDYINRRLSSWGDVLIPEGFVLL